MFKRPLSLCKELHYGSPPRDDLVVECDYFVANAVSSNIREISIMIYFFYVICILFRRNGFITTRVGIKTSMISYTFYLNK